MEQYIPTADVAWTAQFATVFNEGSNVYPRGKGTREILNGHCVIDMTRPIVTNPGRNLGYRFMVREAYWILTGCNDVSSIGNWSKQIANFSDDGVFFFGAYGPRIIAQLPYVIRAMTSDPETRQAVLTIWRESPYVSKDIPCSITCQFLIRGGHLNVFLNMRSSDLWLGVPYDWFNFTMLGTYVALLLRDHCGMSAIKLGNLYYSAASCHYYLKDEPQFLQLANNVREYKPLSLDDLTNPQHLINNLEMLSLGLEGSSIFTETLDWKEYRRHDDVTPNSK